MKAIIEKLNDQGLEIQETRKQLVEQIQSNKQLREQLKDEYKK